MPHQRHRKAPPEPAPKTPPHLPPREIDGVANDSSRSLNTSKDKKVNVLQEEQEVKDGQLLNENESNEVNDNDIDYLSI